MTQARVMLMVRCVLLMVFLLVSVDLDAFASHVQEEPEPGRDRSEVDEESKEAGEIGMALKAAVATDVLTEKEALEIYLALVDSKSSSAEAKESNPAAQWNESPKSAVLRLAPPRIGSIRLLLEPEFGRVDLQTLANELELTAEQIVIAEAVLAGYLDAFELASAPLRAAQTRYHHSTRATRLSRSLKESDEHLTEGLHRAVRIDPARAQAMAHERLAQWTGEAEDDYAGDEVDRVEHETFTQRLVEQAARLDERLRALRDRARERHADLPVGVESITADHLVSLANELHADRQELRTILSDSLRDIVVDPGSHNRGHFEDAMARARLARRLSNGRLAGERISLRSALDETARTESSEVDFELAWELLRAGERRIESALQIRDECALERELAGIEYQARLARLQVEGASVERVSEAARPYLSALRRELDTSLMARDLLVSQVDSIAHALRRANPSSTVAAEFRRVALRSGFPSEMRTRWAERAIAGALDIEDLSDDAKRMVHLLRTHTEASLEQLRSDAIAQRIARDPALARRFIDNGSGEADLFSDLDPAVWKEINAEEFESLNESVESQLRLILTSTQFDSLSGRKTAREFEK